MRMTCLSVAAIAAGLVHGSWTDRWTAPGYVRVFWAWSVPGSAWKAA